MTSSCQQQNEIVLLLLFRTGNAASLEDIKEVEEGMTCWIPFVIEKSKKKSSRDQMERVVAIVSFS